MDQLKAMRIFVEVVDHGSFAAAARSLRLSPASVSRALDQLETHLGTTLLRRSTRAASLSETGRHYLETCRRVLAEIDDADRVASGARTRPRGWLRLTAPVSFGRLRVAPIVFAFLNEHDDVHIALTLLDRSVNLVEEGFDLAFRIGELPDSALRAVKVGRMRRMLCASPSYLDARGTPARPQDLVEHDLIELSAMTAFGAGWSFSDGTREFTVRTEPRLIVNDASVAVDAARNGHGITLLLAYQMEEAVAAGALVPLLTAFERPALPVHLLISGHRPHTAALRAFIDVARACLKRDERLTGAL